MAWQDRAHKLSPPPDEIADAVGGQVAGDGMRLRCGLGCCEDWHTSVYIYIYVGKTLIRWDHPGGNKKAKMFIYDPSSPEWSLSMN